jgi:hypothetical protein
MLIHKKQIEGDIQMSEVMSSENSAKFETKKANYNITCDCDKCKNLIEKGTEFYFFKGKRQKFSIHEACYPEFIARLEKKRPPVL